MHEVVQIEWEKQKSQLADLVVEINKPLKKLDRATLITLCTIDVHARDVLGRLIEERVEDVTCFQWQSQLRYIVHEKTKKCQVFASFSPASMTATPSASHLFLPEST
jgi:hypothetical protein